MTRHFWPLFVVAVAGCSQRDMLERAAPPEARTFATAQIDALRAGNFDELEKHLDPSLRSAQTKETLSKMAVLLPAEQPHSITLVGAQHSTIPNQTVINLTYEYAYPDRWFLVSVATKTTPEYRSITGMHVKPISNSVADQQAFGLVGKSALQYAVLTLAVVIPLFTISVLALCIWTPLKRLKWVWLPFILIGIGKFAVNWTTGEWAVFPLNVQLLGAGASAPMNGPWIVSVSFPLGAILFLL